MSTIDKPPFSRSRFTLTKGFVISALVHGLLAAPWLLADQFQPVVPQRELLKMELFGMISDRQTTEEHQSAPEAAAPTPALPPPATPPEETPPEEIVEPTPSPEAVQTTKPEQTTTRPPEPSSPPDPSNTDGGMEDREQQTIRSQDEEQLIRRYLAGVSKRVQNNLIYPNEARRAGVIGEPVVSFTIMENGAIENGSLKISKSTGYPVLDEGALWAARKSSPFAPPPRKLTVTIGISFAVKK